MLFGSHPVTAPLGASRWSTSPGACVGFPPYTNSSANTSSDTLIRSAASLPRTGKRRFRTCPADVDDFGIRACFQLYCFHVYIGNDDGHDRKRLPEDAPVTANLLFVDRVDMTNIVDVGIVRVVEDDPIVIHAAVDREPGD